VFLKSLSIKGFKSFADATTLEFEPGVTVVVGPNGSGKSNVVDSVAWVLGAQGPRALRSSKMEDVIFAGTPKRQPLGRAEVSLTIDNSAGLLPIDFSEVTITRTLFRSGDSEYAINSVPCRLLEIQDLLSDTGVGRQQHVIVSQGNLDSVLNARPEERRLVIEEAAGILKYRRRKEKAERRLESTESGLVRLQDLLREVRRQLRPLERQAEAARRHGSVASELAEVRRYLFGRDLSAVEAKLRAASQEKWQLQASEASVRRALSSLDAEVLSAEATLESSLESRTGPLPADLLSRAESAKARAEGLGAVLAERRRSLEREMTASPDAGLVASLEEEAAALRSRLHETDEEAASLLPRADSLAEAEEALAAAEAGLEVRWGRRPPTGAGDRAAETRGELAALRATCERSDLESARLGERLGSLAERKGRLAAERERLTTRLHAAKGSAEALAREAELRRGAELSGEGALREAEDLLRFADAERSRWAARAEALESAFEQARAKAGAQRLGELPGVLGALLDLVEVEEGYDSAFESAAGEAQSGVLVDSSATARRALAVLHADGAPGAVVPLELASPGGRPDEMPVSLGLPPGGPPVVKLRSRVRGRTPGVEALLDLMLARAVVVQGTWEQAFDLAAADPTLVVVTRQGDRFARGVWATGSGATGVTAAAVEEARCNSLDARVRSERAAEALRSARSVAEESRASRVTADRNFEANEAILGSVAESLERGAAELADVESEIASLAKQRQDAALRRQREQYRIAELDSLLPGLERHASLEAERAASERSERTDLAHQATEVGNEARPRGESRRSRGAAGADRAPPRGGRRAPEAPQSGARAGRGSSCSRRAGARGSRVPIGPRGATAGSSRRSGHGSSTRSRRGGGGGEAEGIGARVAPPAAQHDGTRARRDARARVADRGGRNGGPSAPRSPG
jgi:chromosome segregation protein